MSENTHCVLVVEDDRTINDALRDRLVAEGYRVLQAFDGPGGVGTATEQQPDLVVLDVMLPGFDGLEVCRRIQAERPVPVLMLTARDTETDLLVGLGIGADDYLTKPFRMREVVARVAALLRRVERAATLARPTAAAEPVLVAGLLEVDRPARRVTWQGRHVHLTPTEFDLLLMLVAEPGRVLTREEMVAQLWGWGEGTTRTVDSHVKALRAKLAPDVVRTVHGVGYALGEGQ